MPKCGIVVVAAGVGSRMGSLLPKPFVLLGGKPILAHTLAHLNKSSIFEEKILVVAKENLSFVKKELLSQYGLSGWEVVAGGERRQDSVEKGLNALGPSCDLVFVHDGARPFVSRRLLEALSEKGMSGVSCIAAIPAKDTLKKVAGIRIEKTVPREEFWLAQTPQGFKTEVLETAYRKVGNHSVTDEASLVESTGEKVEVVLGDPQNIKITTQEDLILAEAILKNWEE